MMTDPPGNDTSTGGQATVTSPSDPQLPIRCVWRTHHLTHLGPQSTDLRSMYASEIVKLYIGPCRQLLNAHKSVLTKIEYFAKCLSDDRFVEGKSNQIELPEDRSDVWEEILHYLYAGHLKARSVWYTPGDYYLETWVLADKYCIEELCNAITAALSSCTFEGQAKIKDILWLSDRGFGSSMLAKLLVDRLAADLRIKGWEGYLSKHDDGLLERLEEHPAWALEILQAIAKPQDQISPYDGLNRSDICTYHVHINTTRTSSCCGWHDRASEADEQGDVQHGG